jgi:hypothetical protein
MTPRRVPGVRVVPLLVGSLSVALLAGCGTRLDRDTASYGVPAAGQGLNLPTLAPQPVASTPDVAPPTPSVTAPPAPGRGSDHSTAPVGGHSTAPTSRRPSERPNAPRQTGPLTIGFLTTDVSNAKDFGVTPETSVSESNVDRALIEALNHKGGIAGRQAKVVLAHTDTGSSNWSLDFQAACATFTQDNHVDVVLGYAFTYDPGFENCLASKGIPHLSTGFNVPSNSILAKYPLFWSLSVPTIGVRSIAKFEGAVKSGFLGPRNRMGIILDDCPGTLDAWRSEVRPYLAAHHLNVAAEYTTTCGTGNNSGTAAAVSQVTSAVLRFRGAGVDRVSFVTVSEGPVLYVMTTLAQTQGFYPGWIVSPLGQLGILGSAAPKAEMRNTHGYGWIPSQDVPPRYTPKPNASQRRCISLLHSRQVVPRVAIDFGFAYSACEAVFLYQRALHLTNGSSNGPAVSDAIASIGGFQSVLNLNGRSTFSKARRNNAPAVFKPVNWDGNCSCFRYGRQTFTMP